MASKLQNISALSNEIGKSLADYENWTAFLKSAAWQYKYSFQDQLFIYAQRPDATACASIDVWNKRLKSWINRGAKGIALLREGNRGQYLDYVFDISDTHSNNGPIRLWQYNSRFDNAIIETLENSFGELKSKSSITDAVISAAQNAVEDSKADYLSELKYAKENSFLDGLDELNIDVEFQQTAETSIAYTVLQRLGINADEVFEREDFPHIMNFNTIPALSVLGNAVSSISEETLRNISETIRAEVREEINARKNFAEKENAVYNEVKEKDAPTINNERTDSYDRDNIHTSERIPDSELDNGTSGSTDRQIRTDEAEISQTEPTEPIHELDDNGQNNGAFAGSTEDSDRTDTDNSPEIGTDRGRERGTESERPDDVDGADEQPTPFSGRSRTAGGSLQLSLFDLIPTEEQQKEIVQRAAHEIFGAAFSMPQQVIDEVLCDGTNDKDSVIETCIEFSKDKSLENKAEFLKNLYKTDGKGFVFDGRKVSAWWNSDGIRISYGDSANKNTAQLISWEDAAKRIDELLDLGRFAPKDTLLQMDKYERKKAADAGWEMRRNLNTEDYPELKEYFTADVFSFVGGYPEETDKIAEHLKTSAGLDEIKSVTQKLSDLYDENFDITRYEWYNPHKTNNVVAELYITRKTFTAQELTYTPPERFISRDEIDNMFKRGSGVSEGKYRIYTFFDTHTDKKERITFLKNGYGWGGSYTGLYNENHDAKGITFSHEDLTKPYAKIQISWSEAEKHIDRLIKSRNYLNESEIKNIPNYEKEELILKIRQAYMYDTDENTIMPYPSDADYYKTKDILMQKLNNKVQTQTMLTDLKNLLAETSADLRSYPLRQAAVQDLEKYVNGEYNLFPHIDIIEEVKEESVPEQLAEMSDEEKQELVGGVEMKLDYGENYNITENEIELYNAITNEPKQAETTQTEVQTPGPEENAENLIGTELTIDDRKFVVDRVKTDFNKVSLKDITFQNSTGFPIFRSESIDFVKSIIAEQTKPQITAEFQKAKPQRVQNTVIYPEIPLSERRNFQITNDELGYGTPKEKFKRNVEAVNLLHQLEFEHRLATPEEQEILSQYVGWGGLADAFDESKENWSEEFKELYTTLSPDEYEQARASTLTAHFTPPVVIKAMYKALFNMGFTQGNILEPSCGIGNFMGLMPESMSGSKMYGVEIDSITGRIAGQLYQKNSVAIQGYENSELPDSFFDVAIGNVPFGDFKLLDKKYNKHNFLIHDYFFAKTLDKVRPGGVIAFITSSGTMDKRTSKVRRYIAQRADLIGAVRLPNNAFKKNAGTEVTADILFLQKRERMTDIMPEWVNVGQHETGQPINQYFLDNPDMVMGELKEVSGPFGPELTCVPNEDTTLAEQLDDAIQNIHASITEYEFDDVSNDEEITIPADPNVRNFSFTVVDGDVYFRENSLMRKVELNATAENRVKGMIELRDCVRTLIEYQTENYSDDEIKAQQAKLNTLYDDYTKKYGLINSRGNALAFSEDSSYFLLCSLEILDEYGELERKADMFTKRTIRAKHEVTKVDTADEALAVSLAEKAKIDIPFMENLSGKTEQELYADLKGVIFLNPEHETFPESEPKYLTADEYLSGNVREKLSQAEQFSKDSSEYRINAEYLEKVQPKDLTPGEISVKLGTTWIPEKYIEEFVFELLSPNYYAQSKIEVKYSNLTGEWNIQGKSADKGVKATNTYGTSRISAYKIIEDSLNLRDVRIFDYIYDENGNKVAKLNIKETTIAQQKQASIKQAFEDWIWKDPDRRDDLCKIYNVRFNSIRPREYDGSHITFNGINPEITLRKHQKDAVARIMYGGNSLLGHVVGAGKTWTMVAAAMESRRLGLCNKSLFVVPNHLTEQWASEFLQLYPAANILVPTKKDFEKKNRKKFCGRIATGDYDAVIIGHSQFEKIPMSAERQKTILQNQLDEIINGIIEAKTENAERYTVKQMEKTKRGLEAKIKKLNDQERKDDVVTFEEIGVDRVFVDEAHFYKNLFLYTKMRNVGGIAQTEAQKSSDLFMKTQYLDELTGGKGVIFATGTPVSNSMVELYTMQRYLQYKSLQERGLQHFDAWASTFGETVSAMELAPEGSGYRMKTRFAKFFNLPELIAMFKEVADIQTADMLNLPVPEVEYHNEVAEPTQFQKDMVADLGERAEEVRNRSVDPSVDNMLKITNDGRKLALDQRMINPMLPDDETSKVSVCADRVYDIWKDTADRKATQLLFCDLSTPKSDGTFSVYNSIREKLLQKGIPENEVAFIHDANTEVKKDELFKKVRSGDVRVLLGSTSKMGAGTNVQKLLYASHDLDCPWRPADLEQRAGRIIRQGNTNEKVHIYRYVTKGTFDTYMWQTVEQKQKFISQIFTSKSPVRVADDIDPTALSFAEIKALSTGNPHIKEKMELDMEVSKLKLIKSSFMSQIYDLEDKVVKFYPKQIAEIAARIKGLEKDIETVKQYPKAEDKFNTMTIDGFGYFEKEKAGNALIERCKKMTSEEPVNIGDYRGFSMELSFDSFQKLFYVTLVGCLSHKVELGTDVFGNIQRIDNALDGFEKRLEFEKEKLANTNTQYETAKVEAKRAFPQEAELQEKTKCLAAVEALLKMDKKDDNVIDTDVSDAEAPQQKREYAMAR